MIGMTDVKDLLLASFTQVIPRKTVKAGSLIVEYTHSSLMHIELSFLCHYG